MSRLFVLLLCVCLIGCQPADGPTDVAARASGKYAVQSYAINGDTLYTSKGVNKINVSEFYILVERIKADSVTVSSVYRKNGESGSINFSKVAGVNEISGMFQLSTPTSSSSIYESTIVSDTFYERTVQSGAGLFILPPSYVIKRPVTPALEGVIISAKN